MSQVNTKDRYIKNFEKFEVSLNGEMASEKRNAFIHKIRKDAIAAFTEMGFPATKNEEWKYTNITPILNYNFTPAENKVKLRAKDISNFHISGLKARLLVLVNGRYSEKHSSSFLDLEKLGVKIGGLEDRTEKFTRACKQVFCCLRKIE